MGRIVRSVLAIVGVLMALPALAAAQEGTTISGRVTSEAGAPLNSASVFLEGMQIGGLTKEDGRYSIVVPSARVKGQQVTLTARLLGFKVKSATITLAAGAVTQDYVLSPNPLRLGEVVITGSGTSSSREKLGAVLNVVDSSAIKNAETSNVVNALAAKAPNVNVTSQSGEPGASAYIRIRGVRSLSGDAQPLFVIDGVPMDNTTTSTPGQTNVNGGPGGAGTVAPNRASDINPNDIESVTVLKGAAAAAIYGAQASNGVILITTKAGKSGATRFSFNSTYGTDNVVDGYPQQTDYAQGDGNVTAVCGGPGCGTLTNASFGALIPTGTPIYDHYAELFHTGTTWDNTLSLSGGNDRTTFYASLGYMAQNGTIVGPNNWYDKTTARIKASQRLGDRLNISGNLMYVDARGEFVQKGSNTSGLLLGALRTPANFQNTYYLDTLTGLHRSYRYPQPTSGSTRRSRGYDNPFFVLNSDPATGNLNRAVGNIKVDWEVNDWLTISDNVGADYYNDQRLEAEALTSSNFPNGSVTQGNISNTIVDNVLTFVGSKTFNPDFSGSLTLGSNIQTQRLQQTFTIGQILVATLPYTLQNTSSWVPSQYQSLVHSQSFFAQASADLYGQLYLTAAMRRDGFSTFGASEPYAWYPKASVAWTFTNALGNKEQKGILSFGKLRAAYGETGKPPNPYATQTVLQGPSGGAFGTGYGDVLSATQQGFGGLYTSSQLGNENLKPERQKETEVGFDFGFFNQKVDAGVTWYQSYAKDIIVATPVAPSSGFYTSLTNNAQIMNTGWEVTANWRAVQKADFNATFGVTWGQNITNAIYLGGADFISNLSQGGGTFASAYGAMTVGTGLGLRGQDFVRCGNADQAGIPAAAYDAACTGKPRGALYIDDGSYGTAGYPVGDPTDRVIANTNPTWTGGLNGTFRYKKVTMNFLVDHREGGQIWNGTRGVLSSLGKHKDTDVRNVTRTFGTDFMTTNPVVGPGKGTPVLIDQDNWWAGDGGGFGPYATQFIEDATYTKLREIGVQYTMDQAWVSRAGLSSIDLRVAARNIYTWTNYTGLDPDMNLAGAEFATQGADYFNNPATKSWIISISLNR